MKSNSRSAGELLPIDGIVTPRMRRRLVGPTPIQSRLIETAARCAQEQEDPSILYQHSVFCQTCLLTVTPATTYECGNGATVERI